MICIIFRNRKQAKQRNDNNGYYSIHKKPNPYDPNYQGTMPVNDMAYQKYRSNTVDRNVPNYVQGVNNQTGFDPIYEKPLA